jgi:hypothetical protein
VTQDEAQSEIARIEREANAKVEMLSAAPRRARPSAGESGIIADAVASMAAQERNAQAISAVEADAYRQIEAVEVAYYASLEE